MLNNDGLAHLTIFVNNTSFVWDGGDTIEVSFGGYAEPVEDTIPMDPSHKNMSLENALNVLTRIANNYANN